MAEMAERPSFETLLEWIKPHPPTTEDLAGIEKLEPGDYEIFSEKINNNLLEAKEIFVRMGVTEMLRSGDLIVGLYDAAGNLVNSSSGTYLHAVTSQLPIKFQVKYWLDDPTVGIKDGDIFYVNDANYGGIHNCDQFANMPIFNDGELIGWVAAGVHQPETGATDPGGMPLTATNICYEGMRLSPIKIGENFRLREDLIHMCMNMVWRTPDVQAIDMRARATACDRLRQRIVAIAKERGNSFVRGLFRKMITISDEGVRAKLKTWNDGTYRMAMFLDTTGAEVSLLRVFIEMRKIGDRLIIDWSGCSPEHTAGNFHAHPHTCVASLAVSMFEAAFCDLPVSSGCFLPFEFISKPGTVTHPSPFAPCSFSINLGVAFIIAGYYMLSKMMFSESNQRNLICAGNCGSAGAVAVGENAWGSLTADLISDSMNTGAGGARADHDGIDTWGMTPCIPGRALDIEDVDHEFPFLTLFHKHRKDSCGYGKYRGGAGSEQERIVHHSPYLIFNSYVTGSKMALDQGLMGGYPSSVRPSIHVLDNNMWEKMARGDKDIPSSIEQIAKEKTVKGEYEILPHVRIMNMLLNGDMFTTMTGGGPGYGDVLERDPEAVMDDIRNEIVSQWTAENVYHVVYDHDTLTVDLSQTEEMRKKMRETRKKQGMSFDDFEKEWLQKSPPDEALTNYGSWPDGEIILPAVRF